MLYDRRDFGLLRLTGIYQWLLLAPLRALSSLKHLYREAKLLSTLGLLSFSRSNQYLIPSPEGYQFLASMEIDCHVSTKCPYAQSSVLRRRLEMGAVLLTCLGAETEPAYDKVDCLKRQPVFLPAFALHGGDGNLVNAANCIGFDYQGNHAYLLRYVSWQNPSFFTNNELSRLCNLASVFSERLDTPQVLLLAGENYRSIYEMLSNQTPLRRNRKKGFTSYSQAYLRLGISVSLVSCNDTGAMQLAIMRQINYRARIAQAASGARWKPEDDCLPEADGHVDGNPLVIAVDMDLHRLERVCRDACQQGRREILVAALEGQMSGLLLDQFPRRAPVRTLCINTQALAAAFGENFSAGGPQPNEPLRQKGGLIHVQAIR